MSYFWMSQIAQFSERKGKIALTSTYTPLFKQETLPFSQEDVSPNN